MVIFLSAWVEGILRSFTNFYLHRKFSIFLRNDRDCKAVDAPDIFENYRDCKAVALKEYYDVSRLERYCINVLLVCLTNVRR